MFRLIRKPVSPVRVRTFNNRPIPKIVIYNWDLGLETISFDVALEILHILNSFSDLHALISSSRIYHRLFNQYSTSILTRVAQNILGDAWPAAAAVLIYQRPENVVAGNLPDYAAETFVMQRGDVRNLVANQRFFELCAERMMMRESGRFDRVFRCIRYEVDADYDDDLQEHLAYSTGYQSWPYVGSEVGGVVEPTREVCGLWDSEPEEGNGQLAGEDRPGSGSDDDFEDAPQWSFEDLCVYPINKPMGRVPFVEHNESEDESEDESGSDTDTDTDTDEEIPCRMEDPRRQTVPFINPVLPVQVVDDDGSETELDEEGITLWDSGLGTEGNMANPLIFTDFGYEPTVSSEYEFEGEILNEAEIVPEGRCKSPLPPTSTITKLEPKFFYEMWLLSIQFGADPIPTFARRPRLTKQNLYDLAFLADTMIRTDEFGDFITMPVWGYMCFRKSGCTLFDECYDMLCSNNGARNKLLLCKMKQHLEVILRKRGIEDWQEIAVALDEFAAVYPTMTVHDLVEKFGLSCGWDRSRDDFDSGCEKVWDALQAGTTPEGPPPSAPLQAEVSDTPTTGSTAESVL